MFDPTDRPRVFGLPLGADFPKALVDGLIARHKDQPPEKLTRVTVIVNTQRMARRIRDLFDAGPPMLLPRIQVITDLGQGAVGAGIPPAVPALRRRLELSQLIGTLLEKEPDLASRAALFDLSDSLAALMDEMHGEGVSPDAISALDVSDQSGHWERTKTFISIIKKYFDGATSEPDVETRQRLVVSALAAHWASNPPKDPVIVAGSTGSRGTTMMLMQAVAKLSQGALILPGFDFDLPEDVWTKLDDPLLSEDHPQYRYRKLMLALGLRPADISNWGADIGPDVAARNRLVSLSLRPAPFTDAWLAEGPALPDIAGATQGVTLVQARHPRDEALAVALRLRQAAEDGQTAALITPDRMLTRRVTAALDQWNIAPDDSAGQPLHLSPPGRFLRHVAQLFSQKMSAELLFTLLKHPLCHSGGSRNQHLLFTRDLELYLRRTAPPYPKESDFRAWASQHDHPAAPDWANWLGNTVPGNATGDARPLSVWSQIHIDLSQRLSAGSAPEDSGELWLKNAGQSALQVMQSVEREAASAGDMSAFDYNNLIGNLLSQGEVRDRDDNTPGIMIWGTLEARVQGAELLILGGLNEGIWPAAPTPDPWLNRTLRDRAGLLLPERRIGLSAHDYQQAVSAKEIWLTRSVRSEDAETVASRWINRLTNLMRGLPEQGGLKCLADMTARGDEWLARTRELERVSPVAPAPRPSPRPPVAARPRKLAVTDIKRLIRDPYAIYAKHILKLRPLDPLVQSPDAPLRGTLIHTILEQFVRQTVQDPSSLTKDMLMQIADQVLDEKAPWPATKLVWRARLERVADWFLEREEERRRHATPLVFEKDARGIVVLPELGFEIKGFADRIDQDETGTVYLYDYKTGQPPSAAEQRKFDKQLLLEAAMIEAGGFESVGPATVARAVFIGLGSKPTEVEAPLQDEPAAKIWEELKELIAAYLDPAQGFTARRMLQKDTDKGDYDQLSRFGEWDNSDDPTPEDLT
ncbi:double-strand break repair protein AddB [Sulfitobacter sp. JL08]|uniref:double-strand break repair protein AddB n=1 Tax=Sulfitobacter sp. JL08 TaxID=2070369 RepID=UPI000E09E1D0|nr:double-strand break repair protein AddB [Sulfitobacter sp. JL08]AXI56612.1 double-strand break repair protein AddB [Sulfitobacter sp. JL08]